MTKTELHTHLMGMLSAEGLMNLLDSFNYEIPLDINGNIAIDTPISRRVPIRYFIGDKRIIDQLSIRQGTRVSYSDLDYFYKTRSFLLNDLVQGMNKMHPSIDHKPLVYSIYLEKSLSELIDQKVEYVEISFSNAKLINEIMAHISPSITSQIKCKFLLSTDRSNVAKVFNKSCKYMEELIDKGYSVGFDVMGSETPMSELDLDVNSKFGYHQKLTPIIKTLHDLKDTTLRIHSGETAASIDNTEKMLHILENIETQLNIIIPPPEIRIGHGVYFNSSSYEYLRLLKKFGCIVEINASSNYALGNIRNYLQLPYNYYLNHGIPVVISSDGHGLYDTEKSIEDNIASTIATKNNIVSIANIDNYLLKKKK